jgi:hypothetical protein
MRQIRVRLPTFAVRICSPQFTFAAPSSLFNEQRQRRRSEWVWWWRCSLITGLDGQVHRRRNQSYWLRAQADRPSEGSRLCDAYL